ncbi:MAG: hypothetical protein ACI9WC_000240 [Arenicella sp.]|jgi:hypothetical protein
MQKYADLNDDSGVSSYEIGSSYIKVWFNRDAASYVYSYLSAGRYHVEHMKTLAIAGKGLNSYIDKNVKRDYEPALAGKN